MKLSIDWNLIFPIEQKKKLYKIISIQHTTLKEKKIQLKKK